MVLVPAPKSEQVSKLDPTPVYQWCQRTWEIAEAAGRPSSEWDDTIFVLAAKHFGATVDEVKDAYFRFSY